MQYRAVLSLEQVTGKDLGNDVIAWQQYVKGEPPAPTPSLAERVRTVVLADATFRRIRDSVAKSMNALPLPPERKKP